MIDSLSLRQNPDGGWPYRRGGSSWTEPTVFALLAGYSTGDDSGRDRALSWLRSVQRADGGWAPKPGVDQSTWVTALAALLPPQDLGPAPHARAIQWLLDQSPANTTLYFRVKAWLSGNTVAEAEQGWSWVPQTAAWATPTAIAVLALAKQNRRKPDAVLRERIVSARRFLLSRRCIDNGWNHGSSRAVGVDSLSYPETTGTALLAFAGASPEIQPSAIAPSIERAETWWKQSPSCDAASWLTLALRALGRPKPGLPESLKPRTIQDSALQILANAGDRGTEVFLA